MTGEAIVLEVSCLTVGYHRDGKAEPLFENLNFAVREGGRAAIIGDSGAGKSTLLNVIAGFFRKEPAPVGRFSLGKWFKTRRSNVALSGKVFIKGEDVSECLPQKRNVGLVMQKYNLYPHLSVRQNLAFPLRVRGMVSGSREPAQGDCPEIKNI